MINDLPSGVAVMGLAMWVGPWPEGASQRAHSFGIQVEGVQAGGAGMGLGGAVDSEEGNLFPVRKHRDRRLLRYTGKKCRQRFFASRIRPEPAQLRISLARQSDHDEAAVGKRMACHGVIPEEPRLAAEYGDRIDASRMIGETGEVDFGTIRGPRELARIPGALLVGKERPTAAVRLHDGNLQEAVYHGEESEQLAVRRNARAKRRGRSAQAGGGPDGLRRRTVGAPKEAGGQADRDGQSQSGEKPLSARTDERRGGMFDGFRAAAR